MWHCCEKVLFLYFTFARFRLKLLPVAPFHFADSATLSASRATISAAFLQSFLALGVLGVANASGGEKTGEPGLDPDPIDLGDTFCRVCTRMWARYA